MTEYTSDPVAVAAYFAARERTENWLQTIAADANPSVPPSLVADTDDGLSSPSSESGASALSLPPRMVLRYPNGQDVAIGPSREERGRFEQLRRQRAREHRRQRAPAAGTGKSAYVRMNNAAQSALYVPPPLHAAPHPEPSPVAIAPSLSPASSHGAPVAPPPGPSTSAHSLYSWTHGPPAAYPAYAPAPPMPSHSHTHTHTHSRS
ncbi:hypothetical protein K488DRAFT_89679, partial [Vararia minispora EC-137]